MVFEIRPLARCTGLAWLSSTLKPQKNAFNAAMSGSLGQKLFGDVGYVTFPCGYTIAEDGDTVRLYYGAADSCIALATGSIKSMLDWLDQVK